MNAAQQCRAQVAPRFSDWDFALRGLPENLSTPLLGAISFATRCKEIPHRASERHVADKQLAWWRDQLTATSTRQLDEKNTARHPSLSCLGDQLNNVKIQQRLQRLLDLVAEDIEFAGFATGDDMRRFFRTRGAVTLELYAELLGEQLDGETSAALGYVMELCDLLAHFDHHSQSGVVYFGQDELQQHQISAEQLIVRDTMQSPAWMAFFNAEFNRAEKCFNAHINNLPRTILVLKRYLALRWQWLSATKQHGFPLYRYQLQLGLLHKHFICFKTNWL